MEAHVFRLSFVLILHPQYSHSTIHTVVIFRKKNCTRGKQFMNLRKTCSKLLSGVAFGMALLWGMSCHTQASGILRTVEMGQAAIRAGSVTAV